MPDTAAQQLLVSVDDWSAAWPGVAVSTKAPLFLARLQYPFNLVSQRGHKYRVERCFHAVPGRVHSNLAWVSRCVSPIVTVTSSFTPQRKGTLLGISLRSDGVTEAHFPSPSETGHGVKSDPQVPQLVTRIERTLFGMSTRHVLSPNPTRSLLIHVFPVRCPNIYSS
jgi:hypothetical protein